MATEPRKTVVITQPMYFPWVGMFEQIALADVLVIYDDVQFTQGGFINRVQTKTAAGTPWLTVPITASLHTPINKVRTAENRRWRARHRKTLAQSYARAPYVKDMLALVDRGHPEGSSQLVDVLVDGMQAVIDYFGIQVECVRSSTLGVGGSGSQRVLDIVSLLDGGVYVTGHGAREYLDHELFERSGVKPVVLRDQIGQ